MEFFNKIKFKLKLKNLIWAIIYTVLAFSSGFLAITTGFSSETEWQIGLRGSDIGIPIPNWLLSFFVILVFIIFLISAFSNLKSLITNTEYNKLLQEVGEIGDPDYIGLMLSSMNKNKYAKGDLRFNEYIIFYMEGIDVSVISPFCITDVGIKAKDSNSRTNYICIYSGENVLKIKTKEKNVSPLLEEMGRMYVANS